MNASTDRRAVTASTANLAHAALAISLPGLFLAATASLLSDALGFARFEGLLPPAAILVAAVLGAGVASTALAALFRGIRSGPFAGHRALVLSILAFYLIRLAAIPGRLAVRAIPSLRFALFVLAFAAEWLWAGAIFKFLDDRKELIADMGERGGETIFHAIREEAYLLTDAAAGISRVRGLVGFLTAVLVAVFFVPGFFGRAPSPRSYLLAAGFIFYGEFAAALFRHYREEFALAGLGLSGAFSYTAGRIAPALALLALSALAASLAPTGRALVPTAWLFALIARLFAWLRGLGGTPAPTNFGPQDGPDYEAPEAPAFPEPGEPLFDPALLFAILKYAALGALALGIFWFLFGPFFKRGFRAFFSGGAFVRYLKELAATLRTGFASLFRAVASGFRSGFSLRAGRRARRGTREGEAFRASLRERANIAKSPEKREEIGRLTGRFAELIDLGSRSGVPWGRHEAPREYALRLGETLDESAADLDAAGRLFEKALYARELLDSGEEGEFFAAVDRVLTREAGLPDTPEGTRS